MTANTLEVVLRVAKKCLYPQVIVLVTHMALDRLQRALQRYHFSHIIHHSPFVFFSHTLNISFYSTYVSLGYDILRQ